MEITKTNISNDKLNEIILGVLNILDKNGEEYTKENFPLKLNPLHYDFIYPQENKVDAKTLNSRKEQWLKDYGLVDSGDKVIMSTTAAAAWKQVKSFYGIASKYDDATALKIAEIRDELYRNNFDNYDPYKLALNIKMKTVSEIEERYDQFPGVSIEIEPIRHYPLKNVASNLLGYISKIGPNDKLDMNKYTYDDLIGRSGIEALEEKYLSGTKGGENIEVNSTGRLLQVISKKNSIPGDKVYLTIDSNLQKVAEQSLAKTIQNIRSGTYGKVSPASIGAAVAIDVNTGKLLACASVPNYDPNVFAKGFVTEAEWNALNPASSDPMVPHPMFDYSLNGAEPPGSTFKMITSTAALMNKVTTPSEEILDKGIYPYGGNPTCWAWNEYGATHGYVNLPKAISVSCDYYFYEMGRRLGIGNLDTWARKFGLGAPTGIELGDAPGMVSSQDTRSENYAALLKANLASWNMKLNDEQVNGIKSLITSKEFNDDKIFQKLKDLKVNENDQYKLWQYIKDSQWTLGLTLSASIGQEETDATPIQIANYIATLVNGGNRYKPSIVDKVVSNSGKTVYKDNPSIAAKLDIPAEYIDAIKQGMKAAVSNQGSNISDAGTAAVIFDNYPVQIGGKTGTAEATGYKPFGWFVAFAPYDKPKIAIAAVIYQGDSGSYASNVVKDMLDQYFHINKDSKDTKTNNTTDNQHGNYR